MTHATAQTPPEPTAKLLAYLRLFRLPNVFTAMADVAMGFLFVRQSLEPVSMFVCLLVASSVLYTAGMVLNDVFDFDVDKQDRPQRPLPSGQISRRFAVNLGFGLLLGGVAFGCAAGWLAPHDTAMHWRSGLIVLLLATCVLLYDGGLKRTPVGPIAMGGCRFFNVLLGMSLVPQSDLGDDSIWRLSFVNFEVSELTVAGGIGVFIVGVTWFARTEAKTSSRWQLGLATVVMLLGIALLAVFPEFGLGSDRFILRPKEKFVWPVLLMLLAFTIVRRCTKAVRDPTPNHVQDAVKQCIFSLIILDASVCLVVSHPAYAIGVVSLLIPTILLGKYVYST